MHTELTNGPVRNGDLTELNRSIRDSLRVLDPCRLRDIRKEATQRAPNTSLAEALNDLYRKESCSVYKQVRKRLDNQKGTTYEHTYKRLKIRIEHAIEKCGLDSL